MIRFQNQALIGFLFIVLLFLFPSRSSAVLKNHEVWELMRREASHELIKLQPKAKRLLYRSLNLMGVYSRDDNTFFTEVVCNFIVRLTHRLCSGEVLSFFLMIFIRSLSLTNLKFPYDSIYFGKFDQVLT